MVSAYSIGTSKRTDFVKNNTPGPGTYQKTDKSPKKAIPSWKIGSEERSSWIISRNPGPGQYDSKYEEESKKERAPAYQFGLKPLAKDEDYNPGPGTYEMNKNFQTLPEYTLRPKTQYEDYMIKKKSKDPGPGFYETNYSTILNQPSSRIGNSQRTTFETRRGKGSPGPGKYIKIDYQADTPKYVFGTEDRSAPHQYQTFSTQKLKQIGPGSYDVKSTLRQNIGPSLTPRRTDVFAISANPGPGTYNQKYDYVKHSDPKFRIGKDQRITIDTRSKSPPIGPGQYSPNVSQTKHQEPSFRIGTSNRVNFADIQSKSPGPGTYNIPQKAVEGPKHIMMPRRDDVYNIRDQSFKPAPNKYNLNLKLSKEKHQEIKIGTSKRKPLDPRSLSPGPGKYKEKQHIVEGPQFSFGKEKRADISYRSLSPGPGNYNLKPTFADVPKYLIPDDSRKKIRLEN